MKWEWFVGGRDMFWVAIILFIVLAIGFTVTYLVDPIALTCMDKQNIDVTDIKSISEKYVSNLGLKIDKSIIYRFVKFRPSRLLMFEPKDEVLLGTFYEWNNKYYIDISIDLYNMTLLEKIVIHETRHMIIEYMKDENIIDLTDYTEEIAQEKNKYYNDLFNSGVYLLKEFQNGHTR